MGAAMVKEYRQLDGKPVYIDLYQVCYAKITGGMPHQAGKLEIRFPGQSPPVELGGDEAERFIKEFSSIVGP